MTDTVSLEVAIEVVLRNGPNFETIAGLCKMAVEVEREAYAKVCLTEWATLGQMEAGEVFAAAIRARSDSANA